MRKAIDANKKIKHKDLEEILGKDFDDPNVEIWSEFLKFFQARYLNFHNVLTELNYANLWLYNAIRDSLLSNVDRTQ